jgi:DUF1680 family protein
VSFHLRIPSWAGKTTLSINGEAQEMPLYRKVRVDPTASGYDPRLAFDLIVERVWQDGDEIDLQIEMPVQVLRPHEKVKALRGKVALSRGPILYCLEDVDNLGADIFNEILDVNSIQICKTENQFGKIVLLKAKSKTGTDLSFFPYAWWGNRGDSKMTVWVKGEEK